MTDRFFRIGVIKANLDGLEHEWTIHQCNDCGSIMGATAVHDRICPSLVPGPLLPGVMSEADQRLADSASDELRDPPDLMSEVMMKVNPREIVGNMAEVGKTATAYELLAQARRMLGEVRGHSSAGCSWRKRCEQCQWYERVQRWQDEHRPTDEAASPGAMDRDSQPLGPSSSVHESGAARVVDPETGQGFATGVNRPAVDATDDAYEERYLTVDEYNARARQEAEKRLASERGFPNWHDSAEFKAGYEVARREASAHSASDDSETYYDVEDHHCRRISTHDTLEEAEKWAREHQPYYRATLRVARLVRTIVTSFDGTTTTPQEDR